VTAWLIDKSALRRLPESPDVALWVSRIQTGMVRVSVITRLQVGFSAQSAAALRIHVDRPPLSSMPVEHLSTPIENRALAVQLVLIGRGHMAIPIADLLIAATAELTHLTVLHTRNTYELIAQVTGQPLELLTTECSPPHQASASLASVNP
jgi:predicted nucleic acid-binding protein